MRIISVLVGLLAGASWAANLDIWEVDPSCDAHRDALQKAYDDAAVMASKALQDLQTVMNPRPRVTRASFQSVLEWDRVARAVTNMFGFQPDPQGHDPNEEHMANVLYVYEKMNRALQGSTNIPEFGFTSLRRKPMLLCGQSSFQWVGKDDPDPYDPSGRTLQESQGANLLGWIGAWVYNHRYIVNGNDRDVMICRGSTWAVTVAKQDMVVFCDTAFRGNVPGTQSAVDGRDSVTEGKKLDDFGQFSLSRIMIHELAHWYGRNEMGTREVPDQRATSKDGSLVWLDRGTNKYTTSNDGDAANFAPVVTYHYTFCSNLARVSGGGNTGPSKATFTAETYAYFGMMSVLDNFDWAGNGKAKAIPAVNP